MQQWQRWTGLCTWLGLLLLAGSVNVQAQDLEQRVRQLEEALQRSQQGNTLRVYWQDGLFFETADKAFKLQIGGQLQNDWNFFLPSHELEAVFGDPEDRIFFRRAQLFLRGTLYKFLEYKAEFDLVGGDVTFLDVYLRLQQLPYVGNVYVGKFKTPFGLEQLTSSRFTTFQEPSLTDAFVLGYELGFMLQNSMLDERLTWALAVTRQAENDHTLAVKGSGGEIDVTLRLTGVPWFADKGRRLVHVGAAYSYRNPPHNSIRFRTRPEARLDDLRLVDTGPLDAKTAHQIGIEGALVYGPLSLQGEYMSAWLGSEAPVVDAARFDAFYVMASVFLTGEHRPYSTSSAVFGRPRPRKNFLQGGAGAWEIAARLSRIELDETTNVGTIRGGQELNVTFGVNWYLNPNARVTWNYVYAVLDRLVRTTDARGNVRVSNLDGAHASSVMMRFQADF